MNVTDEQLTRDCIVAGFLAERAALDNPASRPARTVGPLRLRGDHHAVTCKWPHRYGCSCGLEYPSNRGKES